MTPPESHFPDEMLTGLLDGELTSAEEEFVLAALQRDPNLRSLLAELQQVRDAVRALPRHAAPHELLTHVQRQVEQQVPEGPDGSAVAPSRRHVPRFVWNWLAPTAFAASVAGSLLLWQPWRTRDKPTQIALQRQEFPTTIEDTDELESVDIPRSSLAATDDIPTLSPTSDVVSDPGMRNKKLMEDDEKTNAVEPVPPTIGATEPSWSFTAVEVILPKAELDQAVALLQENDDTSLGVLQETIVSEEFANVELVERTITDGRWIAVQAPDAWFEFNESGPESEARAALLAKSKTDRRLKEDEAVVGINVEQPSDPDAIQRADDRSPRPASPQQGSTEFQGFQVVDSPTLPEIAPLAQSQRGVQGYGGYGGASEIGSEGYGTRPLNRPEARGYGGGGYGGGYGGGGYGGAAPQVPDPTVARHEEARKEQSTNVMTWCVEGTPAQIQTVLEALDQLTANVGQMNPVALHRSVDSRSLDDIDRALLGMEEAHVPDVSLVPLELQATLADSAQSANRFGLSGQVFYFHREDRQLLPRTAQRSRINPVASTESVGSRAEIPVQTLPNGQQRLMILLRQSP